jgi:DNA topoisomerase-3
METAGKTVDDESLREVMKENGIGRPSTRAAIIETLFKRNYIKKIRKSLEPTPTGIELISLIREELLKSAELTGIWEKKLRQIEQKQYSAQQFIDELKQMVNDIVLQVLRDDSDRRKIDSSSPSLTAAARPNTTTISTAAANNNNSNSSSRSSSSNAPATPDNIIGQPCPLCGKGRIIKGRTAYGCSEWKSGCEWRKAF